MQKKLKIIILPIIILAVTAGASWYVYKNLPAYTAAADSTGSFHFEYPEDWVLEPYAWENCCGGSDVQEPDWSKVSQPITLHPPDNKEAIITLITEAYGDFWESYDALKSSVQEDYFAKILFDGKRPDGHDALFARIDYLGPPDAKVESFTDHRYYFDNGEAVLRVEFREKYHHDWYAEREIDLSQYLTDFEHIAQSIKFLK